MLLLLISTVLKMVFVLTILATYSPILVWAERRQSAMLQDRIGPVKGGLPLPTWLANFIRGPVTWGAWKVAGLGFWVSLTAAMMLGLYSLAPSMPLVLIFVRAVTIQASLLGLACAIFVYAHAFERSVWQGLACLFVPFYVFYYAVMKFEHARKLLIVAGLVGASLLSLATLPIVLLFAYDVFTGAAAWPTIAPGGADVGLLGLTTRELRWLIVLGILVGGAHIVAARFVRGVVNKDNVLTAYGLIHPLADVVKMLWKEDFAPPKADKFLYTIAPIIAMVPAFATAAVVPFGPDLFWGPDGDMLGNLWAVMPADGPIAGSMAIPMQVARVNVGVLYMFAIAGTGIVGAAIAGYSSDNKFSLLGGLRAASQMVSYEVTLGLTLVGCFMVYDTLLLEDMVVWQQQHMWGFLVQPLALILFFFASIAEMKRVPFDAPEGESEIVAGYFLEYSGMKFGMFMAGEFIEHVTSSALIVTLFFGGYDVPFLKADGIHVGWFDFYAPIPHVVVVLCCVLAFLVKVAICCFLQMQVRWTLPRLRYDQTMQLCWKIILPLSLANIFFTGLLLLLLHG